jgi:hypothetical protein
MSCNKDTDIAIPVIVTEGERLEELDNLISMI